MQFTILKKTLIQFLDVLLGPGAVVKALGVVVVTVTVTAGMTDT